MRVRLSSSSTSADQPGSAAKPIARIGCRRRCSRVYLRRGQASSSSRTRWQIAVTRSASLVRCGSALATASRSGGSVQQSVPAASERWPEARRPRAAARCRRARTPAQRAMDPRRLEAGRGPAAPPPGRPRQGAPSLAILATKCKRAVRSSAAASAAIHGRVFGRSFRRNTRQLPTPAISRSIAGGSARTCASHLRAAGRSAGSSPRSQAPTPAGSRARTHQRQPGLGNGAGTRRRPCTIENADERLGCGPQGSDRPQGGGGHDVLRASDTESCQPSDLIARVDSHRLGTELRRQHGSGLFRQTFLVRRVSRDEGRGFPLAPC